jgi:hypothetical protein
MRDGVGLAQGVEEVLAADAEGGLEGVGAVVDARVDDLAVAGGGFGADLGVALEEEGGAGGVVAGKGLGYRQADYAAAYYCVGEVGWGAEGAGVGE